MEKKNIVEYYCDLERIVDLKCELSLFNCDHQSSLYNFLNTSRNKLITSIQNLCKNSLSSDKFIYGFLLISDDTFTLGKFIITGKKISPNIEKSLNLDKEYFLDSSERIEFFLLKQLIDQKIGEEVIDISDNLNNIIQQISIQLDYFDQSVCQAFKLINKQEIKSLSISRLKSVDEKHLGELVCQLTSLEELTLAFYKKFQLNFDHVNQLQKFKSFNFNLTIDSVKNIDIQSLGQIEKIDQLRVQESNLYELDKLDKFKNLKYLCLNWNNIEHVSNSAFSDLNGLIALDIGGNEIKNLDEKLFENLTSLEYLNLRHNYIKEIDTKCINFAQNLQFLSLINGYYDGHDELYVDFDSLSLPKLKYLAIRCNKIPILKNFSLEFLEVKGLKDQALENLRFQSGLKGLILVFSYETNYMPQIDNDVFKALSNLVYLAFRFDFIFDAQNVVENQDVYKGLITKQQEHQSVNFFHNLDEFSYQHCLFIFIVSIYQKIVDFVANEMNFSKHTLSAAYDYHEIFYHNFFNYNFD